MSIKKFSPEMAGVREKDLESKIINSEAPISHKEIQEYAEFIVRYLKAINDFASEDERVSFIVDALSDDSIVGKMDESLFSDITSEEIESVTKRIRQALFEELRGKVDAKVYFVVEDIVKNTKKNYDRSLISRIVNINNSVEDIHKDQLVSKKFEEAFKRGHLLFEKLPSHPNIVGIKEYDPDSHQAIYEQVDFIPLNQYLEKEKDANKKLVCGLVALAGGLKGTNFLLDNGLVLQDVHPANVGLEQMGDDVKGVLFDLEGLTVENEWLETRLGHSGQYKKIGLYDWNNPYKVSPYETVYQFGCCVEDVLKSYISQEKVIGNFDKYEIIVDLRSLSSDMKKKCAFNREKFIDYANPKDYDEKKLEEYSQLYDEGRINLKEAQTVLEEIIFRIQSENIFS